MKRFAVLLVALMVLCGSAHAATLQQLRPLLSQPIGATIPQTCTCAEGQVATQPGTFLSRVAAQPAAYQTDYINLICSLISNSVWQKLDALYIFAANDSATALTNLISVGASPAVVNGTVTFSQGHGYTGDGSTGYIDTGYFYPLGNYEQNSASVAVYVLTNRVTTTSSFVEVGRAGVTGGGPVEFDYIAPENNASGFQATINNATALTAGGTTNSQGFWVVSRTGATSAAAYLNGNTTPIATSATASSAVGMTPLSFIIGAGRLAAAGAPSNFSTDQIAAAAIGGGRDGSEQPCQRHQHIHDLARDQCLLRASRVDLSCSRRRPCGFRRS
jgi:hypothetical protein